MAALLRPVTAVRRVTLFFPGEAVLCRHLHPLPDTTLETPAALRQCRTFFSRHGRRGPLHEDRHGAPCNEWLWVYNVGADPAAPAKRSPARLAVHLTVDEALALGKHAGDLEWVRQFLRLGAVL